MAPWDARGDEVSRRVAPLAHLAEERRRSLAVGKVAGVVSECQAQGTRPCFVSRNLQAERRAPGHEKQEGFEKARNP